MFLSQKFLYTAASEGTGGEPVLKTNEQIDKQNALRSKQGLEPLPYEKPAAAAPAAGELTPEQEEEAQKLVLAEAERIRIANEAEVERLRLEAIEKGETKVVKIAAKPVVKPAAQTPATEEDDIDDAALLKSLNKKTGKNYTSLDEALSQTQELSEDQKKLKDQERESAKLNFGLQYKKISKQEIESFIEDTKNPEEVAYNFYASQQKELDATLSDKDIRESFIEAFGLEEKEDSLRFKLGQRQIDFIASNIIAKKHSKYLGLEKEYSEFENSQASTIARQKEVLAKAPVYKRDVEAAAAKAGKFTLGGYEVELDKEVIDQYVDQMLTPEHTENIISAGYTVEGIEEGIRNSAMRDNLEEIVIGILEKDRLKNQAGIRGIIPPKNRQTENVLSEKQKEARTELQERLGMQSN